MKRLSIFGFAALLAVAACTSPAGSPPTSNGSTPAGGDGGGRPYELPMPTEANVTANAAVAPTPATKLCAYTADAMYALEAAYNVPAHAYVTADGTPALASRFAPVKATAKGYLTSAYAALKKARLFSGTADKLGDCQVKADVTNAADAAARLIPK